MCPNWRDRQCNDRERNSKEVGRKVNKVLNKKGDKSC